MELKFEHFEYKRNLAAQRQLFKDCFPETEGESIRKDAHYFWKFHNYPAPVKSWEYAAYYNKDMLGYYAALPYRYNISGEETPVGMVCDVMTSSKYRGKGIFTKLGNYSTKELASQVPFTMGYPIRKEVIPGHLKVGWKIAFTLPLYIKFFSFNSLLKSKKAGFLTPFGNCFIAIYNSIIKTKINKTYSYSITDNIHAIPGYDNFTEAWNKSVPNALIKDRQFVNWRYSAPEHKYRFLTVQDSHNKIIAFVVYRNIVKENIPAYAILDYQVLPGYENCHGLVNQVLQGKAKEENIEAIVVMMSAYSAKNYQLLKNGFLKSHLVFKLIIKNLTNKFDDNNLLEEKNWHLMWVDSDDL